MHGRFGPQRVDRAHERNPVPALQAPPPLQSALVLQREHKPVVAWHVSGVHAPMSPKNEARFSGIAHESRTLRERRRSSTARNRRIDGERRKNIHARIDGERP
jgi:hypothetical protein